ncbi:hypothetical protein P170DRAFT_375638 [Aspergillus steynii IBT 23096]|uniref:DUF7514 domain-containing protein n=1 Tax=Aspergillus steynii IBT 23096 TaxID=1392250 RepID=A0A2I2GS40_9EURO|nr:uncharacterized protein P170DRAFT_375638 [Aspergillus steynii IBT 23096]PLB55694.1 hypothetical protein P170DRAFT_375638 [Aspergillus steynii IBT 23096]
MAYDGYQNSPSPYSQMGHPNQIDPNEYRPTSYTPPYPSQYGSDRLNMPQPSAPPMSSSPSNPYPHPYQDPSLWQQQQPQQQQPPPPPPSQPPHTGRINDAVNSAFNNQADNSNYLPPEVLSQITATVIQQLKETGLNNLQSDQQSSYPPPRPPKAWSPAASNSVPSEAPPSPSLGMHNPSPSRTPNPGHEATNFPPPPSAAYPGTPRFHRPSPAPPLERRESPASQTSDHSHRVESRPKPPPREEDATVTELTTLEKIWGKFFENGKPTERLGQFLRGIAIHLIEAYPPENTLVITPEKMQKFYEDTKVSPDPYPWHDIFDDRTSSISRLFREVEAEHHLVQNKLNERPDIPGLTPRGFERWATLMIRIHPEKEYERLKKAVLNMPISNPDNKKERFPKEIPRRLFPETPVLSLREEVDQFIMKHCGVDLPPITNEEIKQAATHSHKPSTSSSTSGKEAASASFSERERKPYQASVSAVVDDDDSDREISPQPIERQRKPYTAQPGGGKNYGEKGTSGHRHTQSFSGGSIPKESLTGSGQRNSEAYGQDPLYSRGASRPFGGRPRSPGVNASDYRHSESDLLQSNGGRLSGTSPGGDYYYGSGAGTLTGDILEDNRRRRELERENEDLRLYESLREREKEREKSKYSDHFPARSSWSNDEDFYRGMLGGQGGPVGGGSSGYDYKSYGFK